MVIILGFLYRDMVHGLYQIDIIMSFICFQLWYTGELTTGHSRDGYIPSTASGSTWHASLTFQVSIWRCRHATAYTKRTRHMLMCGKINLRSKPISLSRIELKGKHKHLDGKQNTRKNVVLGVCLAIFSVESTPVLS